ncbi:MAG TPA: CDP-alcohol phosphatidyltransferase family protein [Thermodesulfobacteriota bacterium]|nr:CDP-alcohol phosphatidyltransferase family protein [Thermodesulfobacteriota bacterium]
MEEHGIEMAVIMAPDEKGLREIFGIPAIRRLALLLARRGIREIHVVGPRHVLAPPSGHAGRPLLSDIIPADRFHFAEDESSLDRAAKEMESRGPRKALLVRANHVIDKMSLERLTPRENGRGISFMGVSGDHGRERMYSGEIGGFLPYLKDLWGPPADRPPAPASEVKGFAGLPRTLDGSEEENRELELALLKALRLQTKESDGFMSRHVSRHVSQWISRRLVRTPVTPNQVTVAGAMIGLLGAYLLSCPGYWPKVAGALLFVFCIIVDGVDGEIARLKFQESPAGHVLDLVCDNLVHLAVFLCIAWGLYRDSGSASYFYWFAALAGGASLSGFAVSQCISEKNPEEFRKSPRMVRLMALLSNRDFAYLIAAIALVQGLSFFLVGAAVGSYVFAALLWAAAYRHRPSLSSSQRDAVLPVRRSGR